MYVPNLTLLISNFPDASATAPVATEESGRVIIETFARERGTLVAASTTFPLIVPPRCGC